MMGINELVKIAQESLEIQKRMADKLDSMEKSLREVRVRVLEKLP